MLLTYWTDNWLLTSGEVSFGQAPFGCGHGTILAGSGSTCIRSVDKKVIYLKTDTFDGEENSDTNNGKFGIRYSDYLVTHPSIIILHFIKIIIAGTHVHPKAAKVG